MDQQQAANGGSAADFADAGAAPPTGVDSVSPTLNGAVQPAVALPLPPTTASTTMRPNGPN